MIPELKYPSPNGKYLFHIYPWEARMSLWIESPELIEVGVAAPLLRFRDSNWSLDRAVWLNESVVTMQVRRYPGDHTPSQFEFGIDAEKRLAAIGSAQAVPLSDLESMLETLYTAGKLPQSGS
ncbi:MAG: hypothetical protein JWL90_2794 [Chthoniobacteraceae bacterium]|nr:hypothetical protein [Chthoniobacteraceae bacterium]